MDNQTFWMCYVEGGNSATRTHGTQAVAETEAIRLTRKEHCRVFVLESKVWFELAEAPIERHEMDKEEKEVSN